MTTVRYFDPPMWRLVLTTRTGQVVTILDHRSTDRTFSFPLNAPASHTGLVASDDPEIFLPPSGASRPSLSHNVRLLYGLRREPGYGEEGSPYVARFAGIVMQVEDVAADTPTSRYTAYDPWQYLFKRPCRGDAGVLADENGLIYEDARASDIAFELISNTITEDGEVHIDVDPANIEDTDVILGDTILERGLSVGEALQQLCETGTIDIVMEPVYDPIDRPGILAELHVYAKAGTVRTARTFAWDMLGHNISELSHMHDGVELENIVTGYAGQGGLPTTPQEDTDSQTSYGKYFAESFLSGEENSPEVVEAAAFAEMYIHKDGLRSLAFSPAPERAPFPFREYELGDYVPVWASRHIRALLGVDYDGYLSDPYRPGDAGYQRIVAIDIDLDDNGVEQVRLTCQSDAPIFSITPGEGLGT